MKSEKPRRILTVEVDEATYEEIMRRAEADDRSYGYVVRKSLQGFFGIAPERTKRSGAGVKGA